MIEREQIKRTAKQLVAVSIREFIERRLRAGANRQSTFQVLDLLIPDERRIRSIVGGLETSLGTTLWEPLARELAEQNGFTVKSDNLLRPTNMPHHLHNLVETLLESREQALNEYSAKDCREEIKRACQRYIASPLPDSEFKAPTSGEGVDVWLVKNNVNYFFDTKTVGPNVGDLKKYLRQLLKWYVFYFIRNPEGRAEARIIFPYNPYPGQDFWEKTKKRGFPLEPRFDAWVENEFWNFLTGHPNTFKIIIEAFNEVREAGTLRAYFEQLFKD